MSDIKYLIEEQTLKNIADSLRIKEGTSEEIQVGEFAERVSKIEPTAEEYTTIIEMCSETSFNPSLDFNEDELIKTQILLDKLIEIEEVK